MGTDKIMHTGAMQLASLHRNSQNLWTASDCRADIELLQWLAVSTA